MSEWIRKINESKVELLSKLSTEGYFDRVEEVGAIIASAIENGNILFTSGNGGSAADAQHFTGEIVGRFLFDRAPLPAISLCVDPVVMTCLGNDYGYKHAIARQLSALGKKGDCVVLISTSGNSENLIEAAKIARDRDMIVIGFLGRDGGKLKEMCDYPLIVTCNETPRIQEIHTYTIHLVCQMIERLVFNK